MLDLAETIGLRRSIRYYQWWRAVEREKVQMLLEAARLAAHWGNVGSLGAVVVDTRTAPDEIHAAMLEFNQVQVRQAPVLIVWTIDTRAWASAEQTGRRLKELIDTGALNPSHGWSHAFIDEAYGQVYAQLGEEWKRRTSLVDCGQGIAQAYLLAVALGLGACLVGGDEARIARVLELPDGVEIAALMTVGYPLEAPTAGGQRPRRAWEEQMFEGRYGQALARDPAVVEQLRALKLLQEPAPLPWREAEVRALSRLAGLPEEPSADD